MNPNPRRRVARYTERKDIDDVFHLRLIDNDLDELEETLIDLAASTSKRLDRFRNAALMVAASMFSAALALIANLIGR